MTGSIRRILTAAAFLFIASALNATGAGAATGGALNQFASAVSSIKGYNATIQLYEVKGNNTEHALFAYSFAKPNSVTMKVNQGPNAGATVTWTGGAMVRASKSGPFGITMGKSVSINDPMVTSIRGYGVDDLSFAGILAHAQQTAGTLSSGPTKVDGAAVDAITLNVANPAQNNGMTREVLYLASVTHLPLRVDGFAGSQLVRTYRFTITKSW